MIPLTFFLGPLLARSEENVSNIPLVIVESPFSGDLTKNRLYLQKCLRDCIERGESPYASHGLLPSALDEATERRLGIEAGYAWWRAATKIAFYIDLGWSRGMNAAMERLTRDKYAMPFEVRRIL